MMFCNLCFNIVKDIVGKSVKNVTIGHIFVAHMQKISLCAIDIG